MIVEKENRLVFLSFMLKILKQKSGNLEGIGGFFFSRKHSTHAVAAYLITFSLEM